MDLTAKYCDAARELRIASGMADRVRFIEGSALALPLPDAGFDRAYSHNVVMNLAFRDTTQRNLSANAALRRKVETEGQPLAGVHVLMGELNCEPPPCAPGRTAG